MRISLLQLAVDQSESMPQRVARVAQLVREEAGAELVVLPELWPQGAFAYRNWAETAQPLDGPLVATMAGVAREIGTHLHMGSFIETDGTHLFNTSVVLGPDGDLLSSYRKVHLFGFSEGEPELLSAGSEPVVWHAPWGGTGLATCYDLRFPELFRGLLDGGAELVLLVSGWPQPRIEHWSLLARARAIENQVLLIACNEVGQQGRTTLGGRSVVVDPWGAVVAEAGTSEEVLRVDVELGQVGKVRAEFPVLPDRRL